ncbi:alpha/beta fold hydrolase [Nocardioides sp. CPCC 205120]|uniref:alpha/beta fold hydrolase n=1 Tax=Nocardioides sp. CPCC 205120 TaxID=3406462 RepID=UPI003B50C2E2
MTSFGSSLTAISGAVLGLGLAHQAHASIRTNQAHHRGWQRHEVVGETSNVLSVHRREAGPGAPELFFEAGLMNTSTSWLMLAERLAADCTVTVYDRAGYRRSRRGQSEPYHLGESVSDLVDVVRALKADGADVTLVGHSLGGYIAHRAASLLGDLTGLVLVDPMHPQELVASRGQRLGSKGLDLSLRTGPVTVALGGGLLMDKAGALRVSEGNPYLRGLRDELSALSTWTTALREWRYTYPFMLDGGLPLADLGVPVHVVGASETLEGSAEQREMFDSYVASGTAGGGLVEVPGTTHLGIVGSPASLDAVAAAVREAITPGTDAERVAPTHRTEEVTHHAGR